MEVSKAVLQNYDIAKYKQRFILRNSQSYRYTWKIMRFWRCIQEWAGAKLVVDWKESRGIYGHNKVAKVQTKWMEHWTKGVFDKPILSGRVVARSIKIMSDNKLEANSNHCVDSVAEVFLGDFRQRRFKAKTSGEEKWVVIKPLSAMPVSGRFGVHIATKNLESDTKVVLNDKSCTKKTDFLLEDREIFGTEPRDCTYFKELTTLQLLHQQDSCWLLQKPRKKFQGKSTSAETQNPERK